MIVLENVTKVYTGNVTGLKDVSLQIDKGEWVFLVGASGSGKSTIIRLLIKEIDATEATSSSAAARCRSCAARASPQLRRNIGCVFQDFKLLPNRNVFDNVAYALEVQGQPRQVSRLKLKWHGGTHQMFSRTARKGHRIKTAGAKCGGNSADARPPVVWVAWPRFARQKDRSQTRTCY